MIDIVTYINEGGFFANAGANKYIDIIKNFGDIISTAEVRKEVGKAGYISNIPETNIYKKLYDVFNDINKYEVSFDVVYPISVSGSREFDVCTQHWVCTKNNNELNLLIKEIYEKHPEKNRKHSIIYKDVSDFLSRILYCLQTVDRPDILRDTAKFTIK